MDWDRFGVEWLVATSLFFAPLLLSCSPNSGPEVVLRRYIDALNGNEVAAAVVLHTPDAEFIIPGQKPIRGTEALRALLQWDSVMQSRIRFDDVERHGDTLIAGPGSEHNLWFRGIGMDSIAYGPGTRFLFEGDLIKGVYPASLLPESGSELERLFGEFMAWATTNAEGELAHLLPNGLFRYDPEAASAWLDLLDRFGSRAADALPVGQSQTRATAPNGDYISWREHLIDDVSIGGVELAGSDGLVMSDLDLDGHLDLVSVHESDTSYDGLADGLVRVSFASGDPGSWESITVAEGPEAGAAEDAAVGDMNGDGYPDIVVAAELAHLIYLENPGQRARTEPWRRHIPSITSGRGSFIRVFLADFDRDGRPEVVAANKGDQTGDAATLNPISWFELAGDPLTDGSWVEHELTRVIWPINSQPVDLDSDGDLDIVGGSVAETRIMWFENTTEGEITFVEHPIDIISASDPARPSDLPDTLRFLAPGFEADQETSHGVDGFNMDFVDLDADGRLDIIANEFFQNLVWLSQPESPDGTWQLYPIGTFAPDELVGFVAADIDEDGDMDVMAGGYSEGPRDRDGEVTIGDPLGRIAWFSNPGDPTGIWMRYDISRRKRGMFDKFLALDLDRDGDLDFASTRGNSVPYDGVFWLEQIRSQEPRPSFEKAREVDSEEVPLPRRIGSQGGGVQDLAPD